MTIVQNHKGKICRKCQRFLDVNHYHKHKDGFLARRSQCKQCRSHKRKIMYQQNKKKTNPNPKPNPNPNPNPKPNPKPRASDCPNNRKVKRPKGIKPACVVAMQGLKALCNYKPPNRK